MTSFTFYATTPKPNQGGATQMPPQAHQCEPWKRQVPTKASKVGIIGIVYVYMNLYSMLPYDLYSVFFQA